MKKIVIIGSSGFIAPNLIRKLKKLKYIVISFHHNDKWDLKEFDYLFYIASYGNHYHQKDTSLIIKANVTDYLKLLRLVNNVQYQGLFYFSSSSVTLPVQTDYSDAKFIGEIISKRFFKKFHKPIVCIRPSSVYGEGEADFRFIPTIIKHLKNGEPMPFTEGWHDWIYIEDFVDGLITLIKNAHKFLGKAVPIGTGLQTSNSQIFDLLTKISGKTIKKVESSKVKRTYDTKNWITDTTMMKSLGWKPANTLIEGLKKTYDRT